MQNSRKLWALIFIVNDRISKLCIWFCQYCPNTDEMHVEHHEVPHLSIPRHHFEVLWKPSTGRVWLSDRAFFTAELDRKSHPRCEVLRRSLLLRPWKLLLLLLILVILAPWHGGVETWNQGDPCEALVAKTSVLLFIAIGALVLAASHFYRSWAKDKWSFVKAKMQRRRVVSYCVEIPTKSRDILRVQHVKAIKLKLWDQVHLESTEHREDLCEARHDFSCLQWRAFLSVPPRKRSMKISWLSSRLCPGDVDAVRPLKENGFCWRSFGWDVGRAFFGWPRPVPIWLCPWATRLSTMGFYTILDSDRPEGRLSGSNLRMEKCEINWRTIQ